MTMPLDTPGSWAGTLASMNKNQDTISAVLEGYEPQVGSFDPIAQDAAISNPADRSPSFNTTADGDSTMTGTSETYGQGLGSSQRPEPQPEAFEPAIPGFQHPVSEPSSGPQPLTGSSMDIPGSNWDLDNFLVDVDYTGPTPDVQDTNALRYFTAGQEISDPTTAATVSLDNELMDLTGSEPTSCAPVVQWTDISSNDPLASNFQPNGGSLETRSVGTGMLKGQNYTFTDHDNAELKRFSQKCKADRANKAFLERVRGHSDQAHRDYPPFPSSFNSLEEALDYLARYQSNTTRTILLQLSSSTEMIASVKNEIHHWASKVYAAMVDRSSYNSNAYNISHHRRWVLTRFYEPTFVEATAYKIIKLVLDLYERPDESQLPRFLDHSADYAEDWSCDIVTRLENIIMLLRLRKTSCEDAVGVEPRLKQIINQPVFVFQSQVNYQQAELRKRACSDAPSSDSSNRAISHPSNHPSPFFQPGNGTISATQGCTGPVAGDPATLYGHQDKKPRLNSPTSAGSQLGTPTSNFHPPMTTLVRQEALHEAQGGLQGAMKNGPSGEEFHHSPYLANLPGRSQAQQ